MAANYSLLTAMDRLWFFEIILLPETLANVSSKSAVSFPMAAVVETAAGALSSSNYRSLEENNPMESLSHCLIFKDDCNNANIETEKKVENTKERKRPTRLRLDLISNNNRYRSQSSSSSIIHKHSKSLTFLDDINDSFKLQRALNCMPSHALELEELQGFLDLGFRFEKDQITPKTMSMIPGLQRLEGHGSNSNDDYGTIRLDGKDQGVGEEEKRRCMMRRPYLSEAWLVKRPNSPLLRLRMARVTTREEMKKCLKLWATTVASSIHDENN